MSYVMLSYAVISNNLDNNCNIKKIYSHLVEMVRQCMYLEVWKPIA